ncbi:MAG TPA: hypothetical protein VGX96_04980 [Candidatus Elarobacter sp.]|nr:hypothetical protein [Candidatus Elarobacter sp.]
MILLLTNRRDVTTDFVVAALRRRGAPFVRLNTERLMRDWRVTWRTSGWRAVDARGKVIESRSIMGAYYRRPRSPHPVDGTAEDAAGFVMREGQALLRGLVADVTAFCISAPDAIERAEDKMLQLRTAEDVGLTIPRTVVTNVPDEARAFVEAVSGRAIVKPLSSGYLSDDPPQLAYTTPLTSDAEFGAIALAPHLLQERVHKVADLRVTVVGDTVFTCRIASQTHPETSLDWRMASALNIRLDHTIVELPQVVKAACVTLVRRLGLRFGAIDLIEHSDSYTFLEINPNGQWAWIEQRTGAPISDTIADALCGAASGVSA